MEKLLSIQVQLLKTVSDTFFRYLYTHIDWSHRLIGIKGPRGAGKTTLMLQYLKYEVDTSTALYASVDHPYFYTNSIFDLAEDFTKLGGKVLILDEVHKYPNWSQELKSIHDSFPVLSIIFSSSSALDIFKGEADLSRRVSTYNLPGMSLREFLNINSGLNLEKFTLDEIIVNHQEITSQLINHFTPIARFREYLIRGYLPFSITLNTTEYQKRLNNILNTVLEIDLAAVKNHSTSNTLKIKKLLGTLAEIVPYEPNISDLAKKLNIGRDTVMEYLYNLENAGILNFLHSAKKGMASLRKPNKIFLENTNFSYALKNQPEWGNLRETFVLNQLKNAGLLIEMPEKGDFWVEEKWTFEVEGKNKNAKQLKGLENAFVLADNIEHGFGKKIPLWLIGFLY